MDPNTALPKKNCAESLFPVTLFGAHYFGSVVSHSRTEKRGSILTTNDGMLGRGG